MVADANQKLLAGVRAGAGLREGETEVVPQEKLYWGIAGSRLAASRTTPGMDGLVEVAGAREVRYSSKSLRELAMISSVK